MNEGGSDFNTLAYETNSNYTEKLQFSKQMPSKPILSKQRSSTLLKTHQERL